MDTIFALSSGAPPAGIAVVRISGPAAFDAVRLLAGRLPPPREATLAALRDAGGDLLDRALLLCFPGPASATGEDVAELHLHGGRAVVRAVEHALAGLPGLRTAEPGEFTRRALFNGRIDLSEAEGLGDLLAAETEAQRRAAVRSAEGAVRREVEGWMARVLLLSARIEAQLDHSDEDDVGDDSTAGLAAEAAAIARDIETVVERPTVERLRDGIRVVLAGPPNAGKSTLLNALAERDAAIVSPVAGTTRDRIEAPVVRDGIAFLLTDTAGLAERPGDAIEEVGIARAHQAVAAADIVIWLGDEPPPVPALWIHARADEASRAGLPAGRQAAVSAATGLGLDNLWRLLTALSRELLPETDQVALNRRQNLLCARAARALRSASEEGDPLVVAEELRAALRAFDAITGRAGVEAMLDTLFGRFCIGK
jgi:tRNA modification GTPase